MALTAAQLAALRQGTATAKYCLEIDATSPLRYCTGQNAVQVSGDWYTPRWMSGSAIDMTNPGQSRISVQIDDRDRVLETVNYSDRFSGYDATVHILLRSGTEQTWTEASSFTWKIERGVAEAAAVFILHLFAGQGMRQRYGLTVGSASMFPWAPEPGVSFTFGSSSTTTGSGAPLSPYAELYGTTSSVYWSLMDPTGRMAYEAGLARPYWVNEANWAALGEPQVIVIA